jgi:ABC-type dipeptide/oligopeptide/nickel transport system permease component
LLGQDATPAQVEAVREAMGLNKSLPERYLLWAVGFLTGDAGESIKYHLPITQMVADYVPVTFWLAAIALVFMVVIAVPLALLAGRRENSPLDRGVSVFSTMCMSAPGFFVGILFIWVFGLTMHLFVAGRYVSYTVDFWQFIHYLIFPALAIALPGAGMLIKYLRDSLMQQQGLDYVRTAYSRGNLRGRVLFVHVLKNALVPALTMLGMIIGDIFAGSIIMEQVYSIPGMGRLLISSIMSRDFPMVQTIVMYIAIIVVLANMLVDILIQVIDPRIQSE